MSPSVSYYYELDANVSRNPILIMKAPVFAMKRGSCDILTDHMTRKVGTLYSYTMNPYMVSAS